MTPKPRNRTRSLALFFGVLPVLIGAVFASPAGAVVTPSGAQSSAAQSSVPQTAAAQLAATEPAAPEPAAPATEPAVAIPTAPAPLQVTSLQELQLGQPTVTKDPTGTLQLTSTVSRISSTTGTAGPIRAGDVLQYHVVVQAVSPTAAWTAANPLKFTTDLADLVDDAVLLSGVRQSTRANVCGPTTFDTSYCTAVSNLTGTVATHSFALAAGAKHYFGYRVQVKNDYSVGNQQLLNAASVTGAIPGGAELGTATATAEFANTVTELHPEVAITNSTVSVVGGSTARTLKAGDKVRAGDTLQYFVEVSNPIGPGGYGADWTVGSKTGWQSERQLTFEADLSGLLDDAVLVAGVAQSSRAGVCGATAWDGYYCTPVNSYAGKVAKHTFPLLAGGKHYFGYRVQVTNDFIAGDQQLTTTAKVTGDPGNGQALRTASTSYENSVEILHPDLQITNTMANVVGGSPARVLQPGDKVRAGDTVQYYVEVTNPAGGGDWTAPSTNGALRDKRATFNLDMTGMLDDAVLVAGVAQSTRAGVCGPTAWDGYYCTPVTSKDGMTAKHTFALAAGGKHYFGYRVLVSNDFTVGDQNMTAAVTVSGDPGNNAPMVTRTAWFQQTVQITHPDLQITNATANVVGGSTARTLKPGDTVRAGDTVQYLVEVTNPAGGGDWTAASANGATKDKRATMRVDLSGMRR